MSNEFLVSNSLQQKCPLSIGLKVATTMGYRFASIIIRRQSYQRTGVFLAGLARESLSSTEIIVATHLSHVFYQERGSQRRRQ